MEHREEMGMTDLQFKSHLRQLIRTISEAAEAETKEEMQKKLNALLKDLKEDLAG